MHNTGLSMRHRSCPLATKEGEPGLLNRRRGGGAQLARTHRLCILNLSEQHRKGHKGPYRRPCPMAVSGVRKFRTGFVRCGDFEVESGFGAARTCKPRRWGDGIVPRSS